MQKSNTSVFCVFIAAGLLIAGCSAHQNPPATPSDSAATPTNRSFVNSTDQPNTPYYTQPGVNHGQTVALKPIPSQAGYGQNTPLASAVHDALLADQSLDSRYIAAESKGSQVLLIGSVASPADKAKAAQIAKSVKGVDSVSVKLVISGNGKQ
ncbi:MAG TPA: BON domain-containing protein [Capsulimonadaceae bacterium]|nr:BON domain-containing protein [Capsulimonadaceae bacterium]